MDSMYSFEYFEKELKKRKAGIIEMERRASELRGRANEIDQKILLEKEAYKSLIFKKAGWEYRLSLIIHNVSTLDINL